ncbi:copper resistance protein CopC [Paenibacillus algorifonticola]|uniref:copper resistance CopC family protein n=1 Tax=Paenibacillus algorifonticola TaxID=684063 RepID=UPI003D269D0D
MKRIILIMLAVIWLIPGAAFAHSKIEQASPAVDETVTASPAQISLSFNTDIEKLSTFKLLNAAGEQIATDEVVVDGKTMSGALPTALENGIYTVKWAIIGADSHAIEGDYSFTVNAPEAVASEQPASASPSPESSSTPDAAATESPALETASPAASAAASPAPTSDAATQTEGKASSSTTSVIIIVVVILLIAVIAAAVRRRNK